MLKTINLSRDVANKAHALIDLSKEIIDIADSLDDKKAYEFYDRLLTSQVEISMSMEALKAEL